jgi:uncharacterized FlgJ-related protein
MKNKIYYFSKKELTYKQLAINPIYLIIIGVLISFTLGFSIKKTETTGIEYENLVILLHESEKDRFSGEELYNYLTSINIKFPDIVYAQALLETGNFHSKIFKTNNNLFGMKEAKRRPTLAKGTELDHAYYDSWKESVIDYTLYQTRYLSDIKTEEQYFSYLSNNYAEDTTYVSKLKQIIKDLKNKK